MSKDLKKQKVREPWEQSIYEPSQGGGRSRAEKRRGKKGHTVFLTVLVILLFLIIAFPIGTYIYITHDKSKKADTPESSVVQYSDNGSSSSSSSSSSSTSTSSSSSRDLTDPNQDPQEQDANGQNAGNAGTNNQNGQTNNNSNTTGTGTQVLVEAGDTPAKIAAQFGMSVDEFNQLNPGIDATDLKIGQKVRVK